MNTSPINLHCSRCGRDLFTIFRCPERKQGMCPYVQRWSDSSAAGSFGVLFAAGFVAFVLSTVFHTLWILLAVLGVGLLLLFLAQDGQLYDQRAGIMIAYTAIAGLQVRLRVMKKGRTLTNSLKAAPPLHYPLSILVLGEEPRTASSDHNRAARVFGAAIIDLLVKDLIEIQPITHYERRAGRVESVEYAVIDKSGASARLEVGGLERRILRTIANGAWKQSGREAWLDGPRVYELVRAYYGKDIPNPQSSLLDSVEANAAALGLCEIGKTGLFGLTRKVTWGGPHIQEMRADCQAAADLEQQFASMYPDVWDGLISQISKAMTSRIESSAD